MRSYQKSGAPSLTRQIHSGVRNLNRRETTRISVYALIGSRPFPILNSQLIIDNCPPLHRPDKWAHTEIRPPHSTVMPRFRGKAVSWPPHSILNAKQSVDKNLLGNKLLRSSPIAHRPLSTSAFALLAVLWCVGIMTVTVLGLIFFVSLQLDEDISRSKDFRANQLAQSGLALGLHPQVQPLDPILKDHAFSSIEKFDVTIQSEGSRYNLNLMLKNNHTDVLTRLWTQWGLSPIDAQALNDCLQDWIGPAKAKRLDGAEQSEYAALGFPDLPANRPFQSLDEVTQVIGFDKIVKLRPDWQNYFTLWSNGLLDLNEAPAELIAPTLNISLKSAQDFVDARSKRNPPGSLTPYQFPSINDALQMMGQSQSGIGQTAALLTVSSPISRIISRGIVDRHIHTIVAVTTRNGKTPAYYLWQEF